MTIDDWLQAAVADAECRGIPELKPALETLARATSVLRAADFNDNATGPTYIGRVCSSGAGEAPSGGPSLLGPYDRM